MRESLKRKATDAETVSLTYLLTFVFFLILTFYRAETQYISKYDIKLGILLLQVINVHTVIEKFSTLIPYLASKENVQLIDVEWGKELADVPVTSQLRVLTGMTFLLNV